MPSGGAKSAHQVGILCLQRWFSVWCGCSPWSSPLCCCVWHLCTSTMMILRASDRGVRTLINVLTYMGGGRWLLCTAHWLTEHFITWRLHRCLTVHWVNGRCKLNWLNGHYRIVAKWALHILCAVRYIGRCVPLTVWMLLGTLVLGWECIWWRLRLLSLWCLYYIYISV